MSHVTIRENTECEDMPGMVKEQPELLAGKNRGRGETQTGHMLLCVRWDITRV